MKIETCQLFAQLCESVYFNNSDDLLEAKMSSAGNIVRKYPGGEQLIRYLHKSQGLGHNEEYVPMDKFSWNDLKNHTNAILTGQLGQELIPGQGSGSFLDPMVPFFNALNTVFPFLIVLSSLSLISSFSHGFFPWYFSI